MNAAQDSLSRRLGPVFAEVAAQAANAQQGPKSGQQGVEIPIPCQPRQGIQAHPRRIPSMTIYTDQVTGKQYDRMPGGVADPAVQSEGYLSCRDCAFHADFEQCDRASVHCLTRLPGKTVLFVFKERKA